MDWVEARPPLPPGVMRGWFAVHKGEALCGIFHVLSGGSFVLGYQRVGDPAARTERFSTFAQARDRADSLLGTTLLVGRRLGGG